MAEKRFYRVTYKEKNYEFEFLYENDSKNGYRALIVKAPSYRLRSSSLPKTHRLKRDSGYYVCWSTRIRTKSQLDAVVELWCKATVMYIVNGGESIDQYAEQLMKQ